MDFFHLHTSIHISIMNSLELVFYLFCIFNWFEYANFVFLNRGSYKFPIKFSFFNDLPIQDKRIQNYNLAKKGFFSNLQFGVRAVLEGLTGLSMDSTYKKDKNTHLREFITLMHTGENKKVVILLMRIGEKMKKVNFLLSFDKVKRYNKRQNSYNKCLGSFQRTENEVSHLQDLNKLRKYDFCGYGVKK